MRRIIGLVALVAVLAFAVSAQANTITIGLQQAGFNGGAITTITSGSNTASTGYVNYGTFTNVLASAASFNLPDILNSSAMNASSASGGTLYIWITEQGITVPTGDFGLNSSFTTNVFSGAITSVTGETYYSGSNALFDGTLLASHTFTGIGTNVQVNLLKGVVGPYSITQRYTIIATGVGNTNNTIDSSVVPEPGSMLLLGSGLVGLAGVIRRRMKK